MQEKGNIMLRQIIINATVALAMAAAGVVSAAEAGKIVFVAGAADIAGKTAALGAAVNEGDLLTTGADGYIYVKTIDDGLFILRPATTARIAVYHVDEQNPAKNSFKLELLSGIARSRSGHAVKLARQNFRFNTPVAAIGVRGTDFTVFTDQNTSRVAVVSGGITVSGFVGACRPEGSGPCEGSASRELSAAQKGQLLQVQRGQSAPQLMQGNSTLAPDVLAPPRPDEPIGKNGSTSTTNIAAGGEPSLDPSKNHNLQTNLTASAAIAPPVQDAPPVVSTAPATPEQPAAPTTPVTPPVTTPVTPPVVVAPPVVTPPPPVVVVPPVPEQAISWGRWATVLDQAPTAAVSKAGADRIAFNSYFSLFRDRDGTAFVLPSQGSMGFALAQSEAYVNDTSQKLVSAATLENGQLQVDFAKASFNTSFDLLNQGDRFQLSSSGYVTSGGIFATGSGYVPGSNMTVTGVLNSSNASYLFQSKLDAQRTVYGATAWTKK